MASRFRIKVFDQNQVYQDEVEGKKVIYLDNLFWIELTDQKTDATKKAFEVCHRLKDQSRAIFPVSYSAMCELIDQPIPEKRLAQAKIMDALSNGVTFRALQYIHDLETEVAVRFMQTGNTEEPDHRGLYSYATDNLADKYVDIPTSYPKEAIEKLKRDVFPSLRSIEKLISLDGIEQLQANHRSALEEYKAEMESNEPLPPDMESALWDERCCCLRRLIMPRLQNIADRVFGNDIDRFNQMLSRFRESHGEGGRKALATFFSKMPSADLFTKIMAARRRDKGRKIQKNDYYDTAHARFAVYADYFFTEKYLAHILENVCKLSQYRSRIIVEKGIDRLISVCDSLL